LIILFAFRFWSVGDGNAHGAEPAHPSATDEPEVQRHAELGKRHYERERYREAIVEYRKAYELKADPIFLHEIAQSYRHLGIIDRALFFYDRYLTADPEAPHREEVETIIEELEAARAAGADPPATAPAPLPSPPPTVRFPPPRAADPAIVVVGGGSLPQAAPSRPLWKRWWFWGALGAAALGITAGVVLTRDRDPRTPATELGSMRFY
jgi:tetratricopeptide (TPR) repeat protein